MKNEPDNKETVNWAQIFPDENKFGEYLVKSGRSIGCRLDFRITSLEELKKCAVIISELNQKVQHFAYEVEGDPIVRVMLARQLFADSQFQLKYVSSKSFLLRAKEKVAAEALHARSEKLMQKQLKLDLENAMNGISIKRAKDISDARGKQDKKLAKSKPVIDLGDMSLGSISENTPMKQAKTKPFLMVKKDAKVVNFAVKKSTIGYR